MQDGVIQKTIDRMRTSAGSIGRTYQTYSCPQCKDEGWVGYTGKDGLFYCRECECGKIQSKKMNGRLAFADIPDKYKRLVLQDFDTKWYGDDKAIAENIKKIARYYIGNYFNLEGRGLYMYSRTKGTGKTRLSCIIANELIKKGVEVKFATSGSILEEIKKSWDTNSEYGLMNDLNRADVLIIDDFGVEKAKDWRNEKFYNIINSRYISKRPTVFTSNYNLDELISAKYDDRIISRIKETCYMVPFIDVSVRDKQAKENQMELKRWLKEGGEGQ